MSYEAKLREMGYELQAIELEAGKLMLAVRTGNLVYTSGATSTWGDQKVIGKVGQDVTIEEAYEGAKMSALNCLQAAHTLVDSIDNIVRVVKVLGMVNVAPGFNDTPNVINGASNLFIEVFGDAGRHARSAVGMQIPFDFAVEVEAIFEVR